MCGICGILKAGPLSADDGPYLRGLVDSLQHRGPDDHGVFEDRDQGVFLGHRRLSIIDIACGHQPMTSADGKVTIVFNGEIYNFRDLRSRLAREGVVFRTSSDTEVVLEMFIRYGVLAFGQLQGIFAVALYDKQSAELVLARDHVGVKPLYYRESAGRFAFASEIRALAGDSADRSDVDWASLGLYLTLRYVPSPRTMIRNVCRLLPGHYLVVPRGGEPRLADFWKRRPEIRNRPYADAVQEYQGLLRRVVERQLVSDVPLGLFLSGGVDSALLGALMQGAIGPGFRTFSVGFAGRGDFNELADAERTARLIGSEHYSLTLTMKDYLDVLVASVGHLEEPIAEPTIPALYQLARLASGHVKVVLAGQGADEPLGGYHRYRGAVLLEWFAGVMRAASVSRWAHRVPRNERFRRAAFASAADRGLARMIAINTILTPEQIDRLVRPEVRDRMTDDASQVMNRWYAKSSNVSDDIARMMHLDTRTYLADDLLLFGDKTTMAHSLEMRVPFVDAELVEFFESLPRRFRVTAFRGKRIHKTLAARWVPRDVVHRRKRGFATPVDNWLRSALAPTVRQLANDPQSFVYEVFQPRAVTRLIGDHQEGRANYQRQLFTIVMLELWYASMFGTGMGAWAEELGL